MTNDGRWIRPVNSYGCLTTHFFDQLDKHPQKNPRQALTSSTDYHAVIANEVELNGTSSFHESFSEPSDLTAALRLANGCILHFPQCLQGSLRVNGSRPL